MKPDYYPSEMIDRILRKLIHGIGLEAKKAKKYANVKGRSLSDIVENYLKAITTEDTVESIDLTPIVKSLKGTFKASKDLDYKKELSKRLSEKYL